ncbi:metal-dependent hydrolase [Ligilactobacillus hayakitensis]|nr:metal-dependent hydrolase [Ligilactobacillus hayakitensis]
MQAKTHIITTFSAGIPTMLLVDELSVVNMGALFIGSLLPDIDHPQSYLGRRHKIVSNVTNKAMGHRGITHSLLGMGVVYIFLRLIQINYLAPSIRLAPFWILYGYLMHLIEDGFSQRGVKWLWPFGKSPLSFGGKIAFYRTGHISEYLILGFMMCLLIIEIRLLFTGGLEQILSSRISVVLKKITILLQRYFF